MTGPVTVTSHRPFSFRPAPRAAPANGLTPAPAPAYTGPGEDTVARPAPERPGPVSHTTPGEALMPDDLPADGPRPEPAPAPAPLVFAPRSDSERRRFADLAPPTDDVPTVISGRRPPANGPAGPPGEDLRGRRLGHYELVEPIGVGGMAAVLRACDLHL